MSEDPVTMKANRVSPINDSRIQREEAMSGKGKKCHIGVVKPEPEPFRPSRGGWRRPTAAP